MDIKDICMKRNRSARSQVLTNYAGSNRQDQSGLRARRCNSLLGELDSECQEIYIVYDFDNEGNDYGHAHLSVAGKMINMVGKMRKHLVKLLRSCRVLLKAW